ncbi:MAG: GH92 family glycosyl hydrolase [Pirellulaceae bacterium]|nr:GH92 family glycosyl hydrolase [Pirellulaceae bacterium]
MYLVRPPVRFILRCLLLVWFVVPCLAVAGEKKQPVDYVDPLIDSANSRWIFFSSACRPFGMVNLSPDTDTKGWWNSSYCYHTDSICGFNHVHAWQLSGPSVMPLTGPVEFAAGSDFCRSKFGHESEIAQAGYHAVTLDDYGVRVELTSTDRVGMHRYAFPKSEQSGVLFNLGSGSGPSPIADGMALRVGDRRIEGHITNGPTGRRPKPCTYYFVAEFDAAFQSLAGWADGKDLGQVQQVAGKDTKALVRFSTTDKQIIQMKLALSCVSIEQARLNLQAELPHWDFDKVRRDSRDVWNEWLGKIEVEGGTQAQRTKFYTDLWHVLLGRRLTSDVDGKYCDRTGPEPVIRQIPPGPDGRPLYHHYNSDAFWNTFWNINQVWGLAYPDVTRQFVNFMVDMYRDGGLIPRGPSGHNYSWVMIAAHSTPFIVGAYMKGIREFDVEAAYEGMRKNAFPGGAMGHGHYEHNSAKGGGIEDYIQFGYIPVDGRPKGWITESSAGTLEYAYDDWCLAQMAKALGKTDDYELFMRRAGNYRNQFDTETGFMRPRNRDGSWKTPFDPLAPKDRAWCEGTAWQYTWFVPHDVQGLANLMGGRDAFNQKLNEGFEQSVEKAYRSGYVNYGNQPSIQMAHLFNYSGAPWLTQKWVREVKEQTFGGTTSDTGYRGDEDQGQAGGLGVMMAVGLFQMRGGAAVDPIYEVTSPIFDRVTIHLDSRYYPGGTFVIIARNNSAENQYIQSAVLDGQSLERPWFYHRELVDGGTLELQLGPEPNKAWGSQPEDAPPSMSRVE